MARSAAGSFVQRVHRDVALRRAEFLSGLGASLTLGGCAATGIMPRSPSVSPVQSKRRSFGPQQPRIVIVGAGAAGVTCAYRLYQHGIQSRVYEANSRIGGRTWTLRGFFGDGLIAEHGGQLIAGSHHAVRNLVEELGLGLIDLNALYPPDAVDTYLLFGSRYSRREAVEDYDRFVFEPLRQAYLAAGYPTMFDRHTRAGVEFDRMSVDDWLNRTIPDGVHSKIGALLRLACISEYGGEPDVQSALNLIYLLAGMRRNKLNLSGTHENDRFTIDGGNDRLVQTMADRLPAGTIETRATLEALSRRADGSYACTFELGNASKTVAADCVVLSLPFTVLRSVDLRGVDFSARKLLAISTLDLGSNAKLHLQFTSPYWLKEGYSGTTYSDVLFQDTWDTSIGQHASLGTLVCFSGGKSGASFQGPVHGSAPAQTVREYLQSLESALPGAKRAFNGLAYQDFWIGDRFTKGAYSYYKTQQYTTLAGVEGLREGNVHFCGEQTSYEWQGYINGAVQTGEDVAAQILRDLRSAVA